MDLTIIVLAAGRGERMRSDLPQVLHPVAGRPMLAFVLDAARRLEPACLVVVVGQHADHVRREVGDGARIVVQERQMGTAHATLRALPLAAGQAATVLVLFGNLPLIRPATLRAMLDHHHASGATSTFLSSRPVDSTGYGHIVRGPSAGETVLGVGESAAVADQRGLGEIASGAFCFSDEWLWPTLVQIEPRSSGEFCLMDLVERAVREDRAVAAWPAEALEASGVSDRLDLAHAEAEMRRRINEHWMLAGVRLIDPATTYIEAGAEIGHDTTVWPGTSLQGRTRIGSRCTIGPGAVVRDSIVGDECRVEMAVLEGASMEKGSNVGPFSHLRKGAHLGAGAHVGNFGELKNSSLGPGAKMGHFSYLGDATIGANANIGAGTITCNFDGEKKHPTVVGQDAFIGSDTLLIAPVTVGDGAKTGAGSVVTHDVPPHTVAYGVPARVRTKPEEEAETEEA